MSKVMVFSRDKMESLLQKGIPNNYAIISFYDPPSDRSLPDYSPVDYSSCSNPVFQIGVEDIGIDSLEDCGLSPESYFPQAAQVAEFIYDVKEKGYDIICQCEFGQSRNPGCAAAILEHFNKNGIVVFADYRYIPNKQIFNKTLAALKKYANNKTCTQVKR